jgi:cobalt-zinc-cadmium efflux system membrane fusion protein
MASSTLGTQEVKNCMHGIAFPRGPRSLGEPLKTSLRFRPLVLGVIATALAVGFACSSPEESAPPPAEDGVVVLTASQVASANLTTAVIGGRAASATLRLPGTLALDPVHSWRVSPVVDGVVEAIGAKAHDTVRKGQSLARLRSAQLGEAQVAWLDAQATLRLATAERDRNLALREDGLVSEGEWLRIETDFQRAVGASAQAERRLALAGAPPETGAVESMERRLGVLTLVSPADGVVLASTLSLGQAIRGGEDAFEVAGLSTLWVTVHVPVASLSEVRVGARATVRISGSPRAGWDGEVVSLGAAVDASDQTVEARVVVTNDDGFLRPGMYADVEVAGTPVETLMVPASATFNVGNQLYVFQKAGDNKFRPLPVTAGPTLGEWTPVEGPDVVAGVEVVVGGLAELKSHWLYQRAE